LFITKAEPIKEIAGECGIEFSDEGTYVIDRFNSDVNDDGLNTLIVSDTENLLNNKLIVGNSKSGSPLLYRGVG
jgi:oligosaccharyltransferase complex subunit beta